MHIFQFNEVMLNVLNFQVVLCSYLIVKYFDIFAKMAIVGGKRKMEELLVRLMKK